jgi:hypothetical protein
MKFKWRLWSGPTFAVMVLAWLILSYVFMWPPVVRNIKWEQNRARAKSSGYACQNNLRQIDAAVNQWALEHGKRAGEPVTLEDIQPYIKLNSHGEIPGCPWGGKYSVTVVGAPPTCSLGTNSDTARIRSDYFYWETIPGSQHRLP